MEHEEKDWIGRVLANTYRVEARLGVGGMGAVFRARNERTGGLFALKVLFRGARADAEICQLFQKEARTVSSLRHAHIVEIIDFLEDEDGTPFMVMELLEGEDLQQRLQRLGRLPHEEVIEIARQVGDALQAAHDQGIVHLDITPRNIFFVQRGLPSGMRILTKMLDFGVSQILGADDGEDRPRRICGTPYYMAPEVVEGKGRTVDGRTDQFSFAGVLYEALSGLRPFEGQDTRSILKDVLEGEPPALGSLLEEVPPYTDAAIHRGMAKAMEARFPTMREFVESLTGAAPETGLSALSGPPGEAVAPPGTLSRAPGQREEGAPSPPVWRRWAIAATAAMGLAVGVWLAPQTSVSGLGSGWPIDAGGQDAEFSPAPDLASAPDLKPALAPLLALPQPLAKAPLAVPALPPRQSKPYKSPSPKHSGAVSHPAQTSKPLRRIEKPIIPTPFS